MGSGIYHRRILRGKLNVKKTFGTMTLRTITLTVAMVSCPGGVVRSVTVIIWDKMKKSERNNWRCIAESCE